MTWLVIFCMGKKEEWEGKRADNPREKLIYVKEYDLKGNEIEGWVSEEKYKKLYSPSALIVLKQEGIHGDAIAQGQAMWSATYEEIQRRYDNKLYEVNREREQNADSYRNCVARHGKNECSVIKNRIVQSKKEIKDLRKNHIRILKLPIKNEIHGDEL